METKAIASKQGSLKWRDIFRGLIMAVLTPVLVIVQQSLDKGEITFNWKFIAISAIAGGVGYLIKNILEPAKVIVAATSNQHAEVIKENIN
jgi:uncharacterized membrane protein